MSNDKLTEIIRSLGYTTQRQTAEIVAAIRAHEAEKQDNCQTCQTPRACEYHGCMAEKQVGPVAGQASTPEVPQGTHTEFVLNKLLSALNGMLTFFGMDEDENSEALFDDARLAYNYAVMFMRPLEPWERQSLEDFRACVHRWHEKAIAKGYDGVEAMCDTALPYGTRDLRLVSSSPLTEQDKEDAELWRWVAWNCLSVTTIGADKIAATADAIRAARAKKEQP